MSYNVIVINVLNPCIWVQIQIIVLVVGTEKISGLEQGSITNALYQQSTLSPHHLAVYSCMEAPLV